MSKLGDAVALLTARGRAMMTYVPDDLPGRRMYMVVGAPFGIGGVVVNVAVNGVPRLLDAGFMLVALILVILIPLRPTAGLIAYQLCWIALCVTPDAFVTDMILPNAAFFLFLGCFLPTWPAVSFFLMNVLVDVASILMSSPTAGTTGYLGSLLLNLFLGVLLLPVGATLRSVELARRGEASRADEQLEEMRLEIAREMHDLVAYSMSQTALRARRASTITSYSPEARQEFAAVASTATDALH